MVPLSFLGDLQQMLGYSQSKPMQYHHLIKAEDLTSSCFCDTLAVQT